MKAWNIIYLPEAREDLRKLDGSARGMVRKALHKVSQNPLPRDENGYGVPLGNKHGMEIIVIGARADSEVYEEAVKRLKQKK